MGDQYISQCVQTILLYTINSYKTTKTQSQSHSHSHIQLATATDNALALSLAFFAICYLTRSLQSMCFRVLGDGTDRTTETQKDNAKITQDN